MLLIRFITTIRIVKQTNRIRRVLHASSLHASFDALAFAIAGEGKDRVWSEWSKIVIEGLIDLEIRYYEEEPQGEES